MSNSPGLFATIDLLKPAFPRDWNSESRKETYVLSSFHVYSLFVLGDRQHWSRSSIARAPVDLPCDLRNG
jgi:hypothetical protein